MLRYITETAMRQFLCDVKTFRPKVMLAYARLAALLAKFIKCGVEPISIPVNYHVG